MQFFILLGLIGVWLSKFVIPVAAQCPVCIVTVGGGMLIAKKLGIDDFLVSIWISALNIALSFWMAPKFKIKLPVLKYLNNPHILSIILLATTLYYFQFTGQMGSPTNTLFGVDKILFGQLLGTFTMMVANHGYLFIKGKLGRTPFPYAKVAFPFGSVLLITLIFKFGFKL